MKIDIEELKTKLDNLKGTDFEAVEREERLAGNSSVDVTMSKSFQARLAARAMGMNPHDIKELPLKQYSKVVLEVMSFLFGSSDIEATES